MFIPLDRLYEFLESRVHEDTLIYYFLEHGNKNAENLIQSNNWRLEDKRNKFWDSWPQRTRRSKILIMHDQEPLHFDLYKNLNHTQLSTRWKDFSVSGTRDKNTDWVSTFESQAAYQTWYHYVKNLNLKALVKSESSISDLTMICHSEINSPELEKYESLDYIGVYYWSHALICRDWYRYAANDPFLNYQFDQFTKCFNIYNRAWSGTREYRLKFIELICDNGLVKDSNTSFNPFDGDVFYKNHRFQNPDFVVRSTFDHLPQNTFSSVSSASYDTRDYNSTAIDIVLETLFDDPRVQLTEKTLRPLACGKPFMLVAGPGALKVLKDYGFDTFDDLIDTSYDNLESPIQRLQSIVKEMKRIADLPVKYQQRLWEQLHQRSYRNKQRFWSNEFSALIIKEFDNNYQSAWQRCCLPQYQTGKHWIEFRKAMSRVPEIYKAMVSDDQRRSKKDVIELMLEIRRSRGLI